MDTRNYAFIVLLILVAVLTFSFTICLLVWPEKAIGTLYFLGKRI